jgi:hypothetical protein
MNKFECQGKISNIYNGDGATIVTLHLKGEKADENPSFFFIGNIRDTVKSFKEGDWVNIIGNICIRTMKDENGHNYFEQYARGNAIKKAENEMTILFGKEMRGKCNYKNLVLIEGIVLSCTERHNVLTFLVQPLDEKATLSVISYADKSQKSELSRKYCKGTHVCIKCVFQTKTVMRDGSPRHFSDLVMKYCSVPKQLP